MTDEKTAPIQVRGLAIPEIPKKAIADELRRRIVSGVYEPGEQLPSLAKLVDMTDGAAIGTIRAGLKILSGEKYTVTVQSMGTFVNDQAWWCTKAPETSPVPFTRLAADDDGTDLLQVGLVHVVLAIEEDDPRLTAAGVKAFKRWLTDHVPFDMVPPNFLPSRP